MHEVRDALIENNLSIEDLFEVFNRAYPSEIGFGPRECNSQEQSATKQEEQSDETSEEQKAPKPPFDPTDTWVIPWAAEMERKLYNDPRLEDKDLRTLTRVQKVRDDKLRPRNDIVWLRDIAHKCRFKVPDECFVYMEATSRQDPESGDEPVAAK